MSASTALRELVKRSPLRPFIQRRHVHAYCLGAPKTGTTSIAMMMRAHYRSEHEPLGAGTVELLRAVVEGGPEPDWDRALRRRDRELHLDMEASHPLTPLAGHLARTFPSARFVLVFREPRSWLRSIVNMRLTKAVRRFEPLPPFGKERLFGHLNEWYYRRRHPVHPPEEKLLEELGLYTLDGYLSGWALHNRLVLDQVPAERLLVLEVSDLSRHPERLADFLGIPESSLDMTRSHVHRAAKEHGVLEQLDQERLDEKIERHCSDLLDSLRVLRDLSAARYPGAAARSVQAVPARSGPPATW